LGKKPIPEKVAFVIDARKNLCLLLLKVNRSINVYAPVRTGSARRLQTSSVLTSGYMSPDASYIQYSDQITSREGPAGYTWILHDPVTTGQSGSPIYTSDGIVVGVMKGDFGGHGIFVPIENAATLLLPILLDPKGNTR
jgi:V8-like Glu-specific endopeptidase